MDIEELTDNKSIANQINIEAMTISTLASSLKTEHGVNIQYDAIIQAARRLFDLADYIKSLQNNYGGCLCKSWRCPEEEKRLQVA